MLYKTQVSWRGRAGPPGRGCEAPLRIAQMVSQVNEERQRAMGRKVVKACGGSVKNRTVAVLGLAFKPNTDDMREAPAIAIIQALQDAGAKVRAYDPAAMDNAREVIEGIEYAADAYACIDSADAMVLVTEWDMFRALDTTKMKQLLKQPIVVDLRNVYRPDEMQEAGIEYVGVGR